MINTTDALIFISTGTIHANVRESIAEAFQTIENTYGAPPTGRISVKRTPQFSFHHCFREGPSRKQYDTQFVEAIFKFCVTDSQNRASPKWVEIIGRYTNGIKPSANGYAGVKRGCKLVLLALWERGCLILPTTFLPGPCFQYPPTKNPLIHFLRSYKAIANDASLLLARKFSSNTARLFHAYGERIIYASTWKSIADVSLADIATLHRARLLMLAGDSETIVSNMPFPFTLFTHELLSANPNEVTYSADELGAYREWTDRQFVVKMSFPDFLACRKSLPPMIHRAISDREKKQANAKKRSSHELRKAEPVAVVRDDQGIFRYLQKFAGKHRARFAYLEDKSFYPGREHVPISELSRNWVATFESYLDFRARIQGVETDKGVVSLLNIFADYLFLYLPWWNELHPTDAISIPKAPKYFTRYPFIARIAPPSHIEFPMTLSEFIRGRRSKGLATAVVGLEAYFDFVQEYYEDEETIAGASFRNPIKRKLDKPRESRPSKTNKVPFSRAVYPALVAYGYAVEAFGEFILERTLSGDLPFDVSTVMRSKWYDTELCGYVPLARIRGRFFAVSEIPAVFPWCKRSLPLSAERPHSEKPEQKNFVRIPHLTALRLLQALVETGLRGQHVQWLDLRLWDDDKPKVSQEFSYMPHGEPASLLFVNTDKSKEEPWRVPMIYRTWGLLKRETDFQTKFADEWSNVEVEYERRTNSRFAPLVALFRTPLSAYPIDDRTYHEHWKKHIASFQIFFRSMSGEQTSFIQVVQRGFATESSEDKNVVGAFTPVSFLPVHTPHACRATFATNRQGVLETDEICEFLGHTDMVVTRVYQVARLAELKERLVDSDRAILPGWLSSDGAVQSIRADAPDSALRQSFAANRDATLLEFGFSRPISMWSMDETANGDLNGLRLLRDSPMSRIAFHETHICPVGDECPEEVIREAGDKKRCGVCPIAMKCLEHLPAIAAKQNNLIERIIFFDKKKDRMIARNEPQEAIAAVWDEMELDANEYLGWRLNEELLVKEATTKSEQPSRLLAHQPEFITRHLEQVCRESSMGEFLLQRLMESDAYPSLETPEVRATASRVKRRLLANPLALTDWQSDAGDDVAVAASLIRTLMESKAIGIETIATYLLSEPDLPARPSLLMVEA